IAPGLDKISRAHADASVRLYDTSSGQEKGRVIVGDAEKGQHGFAMEFSLNGKALHVLLNQNSDWMIIDIKTGKIAPAERRRELLDAGKEQLLAALSPYL